MKINTEYLLDAVIEWRDAKNEYYHASKKHYAKYGYGVNIDRPRDDEQKHIAWAYREESSAWRMLDAVMTVTDLDRDERERAYSAARALVRWYIKTKWERIPPASLVEALEKYISE